MLRLYARVTVYRKNEESNIKELDFPYTSDDVDHFKEEIYRLLNGVHLVDDNVNVYVLGVADVKQIM